MERGSCDGDVAARRGWGLTATRAEAVDGELRRHVMEASSPVRREQKGDGDRVLQDIGAGAVPQILVCNKLDRLEPSARPRQRVDVFEDRSGRQVTRVFVSALEGTGLEDLRGAIAARAVSLHEPQTDDEPHPGGQSHLHALTDS